MHVMYDFMDNKNCLDNHLASLWVENDERAIWSYDISPKKEKCRIASMDV